MKELNAPRDPFGEYKGAYLLGNLRRTDVPIVIDTGASFSLTPFMENFVSPLEPADTDSMSGLADSVKVHGMGWVEWSIRDTFGQVALNKTKAYYVPSAEIRLMSPQSYFRLRQNSRSHE